VIVSFNLDLFGSREHLGALKSLRAWDTVACIVDSGLRHGVLIES